MSRPFALTPDAVREIREWAATPRNKRRFTRVGLALRLKVSEHTVSRAANASRSYAKVQP